MRVCIWVGELKEDGESVSHMWWVYYQRPSQCRGPDGVWDVPGIQTKQKTPQTSMERGGNSEKSGSEETKIDAAEEHPCKDIWLNSVWIFSCFRSKALMCTETSTISYSAHAPLLQYCYGNNDRSGIFESLFKSNLISSQRHCDNSPVVC